MMDDAFDDADDDEFDHFTDAQDTVWGAVTGELSEGRKTTHWMWFVFPVLEGVGQSPTALFYALRDLDEARDYLAHPVLAARLVTCMELMAQHDGKTAAEVLGTTDAYKLHNCATLFAQAAAEPKPFNDVLRIFFAGQPAERTTYLLSQQGGS